MLSWVKRIVPFVAAFTLGLLVASLFVSIGLPRMKSKKNSCYDRNYEKYNNRTSAETAKEEAEKARQDAIQAQNEAFESRGESCRMKSRAERKMREAERKRTNKEKFENEIPPVPYAPIAPAVR